MYRKQYNSGKSMKPRQLFGLGLMITTIGTVWLLAMFNDARWYAENVSNDFVFVLCLLSALLMAIGGYIIILASFDR